MPRKPRAVTPVEPKAPELPADPERIARVVRHTMEYRVDARAEALTKFTERLNLHADRAEAEQDVATMAYNALGAARWHTASLAKACGQAEAAQAILVILNWPDFAGDVRAALDAALKEARKEIRSTLECDRLIVNSTNPVNNVIDAEAAAGRVKVFLEFESWVSAGLDAWDAYAAGQTAQTDSAVRV